MTADTTTRDDAITSQEAAPTTDVQTPTEGADGADQGTEKGNPNREAAKYRTKLRETEAERDRLAGRLEALQRAEIARLAADRLAVGADVLDIAGATLTDLLNDEGDVDPAKVTAAADALLESRPNLARRKFAGSADGGARGEALEPSRPDPIKAAADLIRNGGKAR